MAEFDIFAFSYRSAQKKIGHLERMSLGYLRSFDLFFIRVPAALDQGKGVLNLSR